jgi:hypothetical protein
MSACRASGVHPHRITAHAASHVSHRVARTRQCRTKAQVRPVARNLGVRAAGGEGGAQSIADLDRGGVASGLAPARPENVCSQCASAVGSGAASRSIRASAILGSTPALARRTRPSCPVGLLLPAERSGGEPQKASAATRARSSARNPVFQLTRSASSRTRRSSRRVGSPRSPRL